MKELISGKASNLFATVKILAFITNKRSLHLLPSFVWLLDARNVQCFFWNLQLLNIDETKYLNILNIAILQRNVSFMNYIYVDHQQDHLYIYIYIYKWYIHFKIVYIYNIFNIYI